MDNKFVITGANSMVGINLIKFLLSKNKQVLAIARTITEELQEFQANSLFKLCRCDLGNIQKIQLPEEYDVFIHLAWMGTFGDERNDMHLQNMNITYTLDCVNLASRLKCKTFLGVGSQAEYGRVNKVINHYTREKPENGYGIAKLCANKMSKIMSEQLGMKHVWVRLFSVYGPGDHDKSLIMSSITAMLNGKVPKYTAAIQIWDYLYVEDAVSGIYLAATLGHHGKTYLIANGKQRTLKDYIYCIRDNIDSKLDIKFGEIPYLPNQVLYLMPNIKVEKEELGFVPKYTFSAGIKKTIAWYKHNKL